MGERLDSLRASAAALALGTAGAAACGFFNAVLVLESWNLLATVAGAKFADEHHWLLPLSASALGAIAFAAPAVALVATFPHQTRLQRQVTLRVLLVLHVTAVIVAAFYVGSRSGSL